MKHILNLFCFFAICMTALSCSTNYYTVLLSEDAKIYNSTDSINIITTIPKNTEVFLSSKSKKSYKKIKWGNYSGWAYNPIYTAYSNYVSSTTPSSKTSSYNYKSGNTSSGGSVSVKGYYRKNGTYVRPHTRSAPSRRR
ncbi:hypothetical protein NK356_10085 [Chryseobacterium sp. S0630]|uniref:hypothetical protein n=1 Tax=Chryseobacterium sp. S0630 TaxID=2957803 RepID=UPI00209D71B7|nr:hypothetical protein [Chryseobacterium sp. S0630]MCP1299517.1 hypothetical protein [Chryseobacterium sp. S0630]